MKLEMEKVPNSAQWVQMRWADSPDSASDKQNNNQHLNIKYMYVTGKLFHPEICEYLLDYHYLLI